MELSFAHTEKNPKILSKNPLLETNNVTLRVANKANCGKFIRFYLALLVKLNTRSFKGKGRTKLHCMTHVSLKMSFIMILRIGTHLFNVLHDCWVSPCMLSLKCRSFGQKGSFLHIRSTKNFKVKYGTVGDSL